mmetsp:Transcript_187/g.272  ORF Transcript_187/g.272 Transcript_187/m.272 type:complete len:123 (+) Transcript_187:282-650(+)
MQIRGSSMPSTAPSLGKSITTSGFPKAPAQVNDWPWALLVAQILGSVYVNFRRKRNSPFIPAPALRARHLMPHRYVASRATKLLLHNDLREGFLFRAAAYKQAVARYSKSDCQLCAFRMARG